MSGGGQSGGGGLSFGIKGKSKGAGVPVSKSSLNDAPVREAVVAFGDEGARPLEEKKNQVCELLGQLLAGYSQYFSTVHLTLTSVLYHVR